MVIPSGQEIKSFKPPAWLIAKAQNATTLSGFNQGALADKLQAIKQQKEGNTEKHQESMSALAKKMNELNAKHNLNPFKATQQPHRAEQNIEQAPLLAPKVIKRVVAGKRKIQIQKPDERRAKKEKVRKEQMIKPTKKKTPSPKDEPKSPSESAEAVREPMDIGVVPSNTLFVASEDRYPAAPRLPQWHTSITGNELRMKEISRKRPQALTALDTLKDCIKRCEQAKKPADLNKLYEELRDHIHKAEILITVDKYIVKKANILTPGYGLPRIFKEDSNFPPDLKADSYLLYTRWYKQDFEQAILRGIVTIKGKDRNGDRLDATYRSKFPNSAKYHGEGDLVLGQWWPTQLCAVRDGAHGSSQGGISGEKEKGTYSIVLSSGGYHDTDNGESIEYSGTEGKDGVPTENTSHMLLSEKLGHAIRVIRSSQLPKKNAYRPEMGLRYDGLYVIKNHVLVDAQKAMYRFHLERCEGQEPIRYQGKAKRPTLFEVQEYERLKTKVW